MPVENLFLCLFNFYVQENRTAIDIIRQLKLIYIHKLNTIYTSKRNKNKEHVSTFHVYSFLPEHICTRETSLKLVDIISITKRKNEIGPNMNI